MSGCSKTKRVNFFDLSISTSSYSWLAVDISFNSSRVPSAFTPYNLNGFANL